MSGPAGDRRFDGRFASSLESRAFLGIGWAFPLGFAATGDAAMAVLEEDVAQAIRIILGTNPGERVMRPDFGAGLDDFLFERRGPVLHVINAPSPAATAAMAIARRIASEVRGGG